MDNLAAFETAVRNGPSAPTRYAIRQALDQEYQKHLLRLNADARQARYKAGGSTETEAATASERRAGNDTGVRAESKPTAAKRDFFGRIIDDVRPASMIRAGIDLQAATGDEKQEDRKVWVSFHEGFSNAVRKPITLEELMRGF